MEKQSGSCRIRMTKTLYFAELIRVLKKRREYFEKVNIFFNYDFRFMLS